MLLADSGRESLLLGCTEEYIYILIHIHIDVVSKLGKHI